MLNETSFYHKYFHILYNQYLFQSEGLNNPNNPYMHVAFYDKSFTLETLTKPLIETDSEYNHDYECVPDVLNNDERSPDLVEIKIIIEQQEDVIKRLRSEIETLEFCKVEPVDDYNWRCPHPYYQSESDRVLDKINTIIEKMKMGYLGKNNINEELVKMRDMLINHEEMSSVIVDSMMKLNKYYIEARVDCINLYDESKFIPKSEKWKLSEHICTEEEFSEYID